MSSSSPSSLKSILAAGISGAWPICLGYLPIGIAFGVLAQKAGLNPLEIGLMSILVFAGSAQFIGVSMIAAQASPFSIILTTFMVNLRHVLMSSALSIFLKKIPKPRLALFGYGVTDESFAINYVRFRDGRWTFAEALVLNHTANLTWFFSTVLGGWFGRFIPAKAFGIDYALIAMFICLLVFQLNSRRAILVAVISGALATMLALYVPGNAYIVLASIAAATLGLFIGRQEEV